MDYKNWKPQGLSRQRDENAVSIDLAPLKQLHSRNKSMSALNSTFMPPSKGLNANPVRRTAFADISNKGKGVNVQDDLIAKGKISQLDVKPVKPSANNFSNIILQPLQPLDNNVNRAKALLRPTQRPLSSINQKALPAEPINSNIVAASHGSDFLENSQPRRTLIKRHTTIFRETSAAVNNPLILSDLKPITAIPSQPPQVESKASEPLPDLPSQLPVLAPSEPILESVLSASSSAEENIPAVEQVVAPITDSFESVPLPQPVSVHSAVAETFIEPELYLPALENQRPSSIETLVQEDAAVKTVDIAPLRQNVIDVEEYWDEEEEEFFDAEGCITARSIRSVCGDNTTGGVSIVLNPRMNARVERELAAAKAWVDENISSEDVEEEAWDTTMVAEYGDEIFAYMRDLENRMMPNPYYMENQAEIQWSMRSVLIDWVAQVHLRFALLPETLFLAVNCIDRFLSVKVVSLAKLQLVGATALYVAAKYEEINCPSVQEIAYMVDGSYTVEEILKAERFMLTMLKFEMGWPGPMSFLRRISKADDYDVETRTLAKYFLEVCLMDERFVGSLPSFLAAGSHCLARLMLRKGDWGAAHVHYSQCTYTQLRPLISTILECCQQQTVHHAAIFDKYSNRQYKRASVFVQGEITKGFVLPILPRESTGNHTASWRRK